MTKYFGIVIFLILVGCEQKFDPDIEPQESILVFEGFISDQSKSHTIRISESLSFDYDSSFKAVPGFNVTIEDEFGNTIILAEQKPGYYVSDSHAKGEIGTRYRMVAVSASGKRYFSHWELLSKSAPVDSIYGNYAEQTILRYYEATGYTEERIPGIDVLNSANAVGFSSFYRYEYRLVYQSINIYPGTPMPKYVYIARPAASFNTDFIATANSNLYAANKIIDNKVQFISSYSMYQEVRIDSLEIDSLGEEIYEPDEISFQQHGFLIDLQQYSLSESGFKFWDAIYNQSHASGQIFDPVDAQIIGNIICEQDSTELVFGYFGASSMTSKSMYLNLKGSNSVRVQSTVYFPNLSGTIISNAPFDFWVD